MTRDQRRPPNDSDCLRPEDPKVEPGEFEQLSLHATVTGPGMRTEDYYERGAQLKIKGERGVFTYRYASISQAGMVSLHLVGQNGTRAVRPDRVSPVRRRRIMVVDTKRQGG